MGFKDDNIGKLADEAKKRKDRLFALRKRKTPDVDCENNQVDAEDIDIDKELPTSQVLFRNYQPLNEKLESNVLPKVEPSNVEELVKEQLEDAKTVKEISHVEMNSLAPKKVTFDLRRGIEKQLAKLDRRTEKAIAELIRDRLKEGKQQDFLLALSAGVNVQKKAALESDEED